MIQHNTLLHTNDNFLHFYADSEIFTVVRVSIKNVSFKIRHCASQLKPTNRT
jgi:hypothetical protein